MFTPISFTSEESTHAVSSICNGLTSTKDGSSFYPCGHSKELSRLFIPDRLLSLPNAHRASLGSLCVRTFAAVLQPIGMRKDGFIPVHKKLHPQNYQGRSTETSEQGFVLDPSVGEAMMELKLIMNCSATGKHKYTFPLYQLWHPHRTRNKKGFEAIDSITLYTSEAFMACLNCCPREILERAIAYLSNEYGNVKYIGHRGAHHP